jgi:hypothetical protein
MSLTSFTARHRLDQMAENRGWSRSKRTMIDHKGLEHAVSVYTAPCFEMEVVWTGCDHVSRATLRRTDTGLTDETASEWTFLPSLKRWDKRFCWCAVRIYDLAPTDAVVIPHARTRSAS